MFHLYDNPPGINRKFERVGGYTLLYIGWESGIPWIIIWYRSNYYMVGDYTLLYINRCQN